MGCNPPGGAVSGNLKMTVKKSIFQSFSNSVKKPSVVSVCSLFIIQSTNEQYPKAERFEKND